MTGRWRLYFVPPVRRPDGTLEWVKAECGECGAIGELARRMDDPPDVTHEPNCPNADWSFLPTRELQAAEVN